jgi:hypothetical protein
MANQQRHPAQWVNFQRHHQNEQGQAEHTEDIFVHLMTGDNGSLGKAAEITFYIDTLDELPPSD